MERTGYFHDLATDDAIQTVKAEAKRTAELTGKPVWVIRHPKDNVHSWTTLGPDTLQGAYLKSAGLEYVEEICANLKS